MLVGVLVCAGYVALLIALQRASGVPYDRITDDASSLRRGVAIPVAVCTALLVAFTAATGRLTEAFHYEPRASAAWLWIVPVVIALGIVLRLLRAPWRSAGTAYVVWALVGTALVGLSEELLVRGYLVDVLQDGGLAPWLVALVSSLVFGVLHGANALNGQDLRTTAMQVGSTVLMGLALFTSLAASGTLWLPIALHFLFDFSLVVQGQMNKVDERQSTAESLLVLAMYALPLPALFFLG